VEQLENRDTSLLRLRLATRPEHLHDAIVAYKAHVYRGLVARARSEVEWARSGLDMVDRLEAAAALQEAGEAGEAGGTGETGEADAQVRPHGHKG
jgi:hypothetical protein